MPRGGKVRLTMRAEVVRDVEGSATNIYGHTTTSEQTIHSSLPCFMWPNSERYSGDIHREVVVGDYTMLVGYKQDIRELDRIRAIKDADGSAVITSEETDPSVLNLHWGSLRLTWAGMPLVWEERGDSVILGRLRVLKVLPRLGWSRRAPRFKEVGLELVT